MLQSLLIAISFFLSCPLSDAFGAFQFQQHIRGLGFPRRQIYSPGSTTTCSSSSSTTTTQLHMALDLVTYLRVEWISAALCTNQTPRAADVCLQLGVQDGRAVTFIPRTIRELITSSAEPDGKLTMAARRQLAQQQEQRKAARVTYVDQRCDDLKETPDASVDVVISLQAAARMLENGQDWKKSIREAARVLKPGGRLLFVEQTELAGESFLEYVENLTDNDNTEDENDDVDEPVEKVPIFETGSDEVNLVLIPHIAGVAIKSDFAGISAQELAKQQSDSEKDRMAELSIQAFERGLKKRKRKKKTKAGQQTEQSTT